jgi:hypothetical protein
MQKMMTVVIGYRSEIAFKNDQDAFDFYTLLKKGLVLKDKYMDNKVFTTPEDVDISLKEKEIYANIEIEAIEEEIKTKKEQEKIPNETEDIDDSQPCESLTD